jgi:hypothetical protein
MIIPPASRKHKTTASRDGSQIVAHRGRAGESFESKNTQTKLSSFGSSIYGAQVHTVYRRQLRQSKSSGALSTCNLYPAMPR